jgi:Protein of unknown function (DUF3089)
MVSGGHRLSSVVVLVAVLAALAGCGGNGNGSRPTSTAAGAPSATPRDQWGTVWLCRPGLAHNPCTLSLMTTVVGRAGATHIQRASPAGNPTIDCFYVYPTVSGQPRLNASLAIGIRERAIAIAQASRFSQVCRVYAPVYRQVTLGALEHPRGVTRASALVAYESLRLAFHDYLAHYNHGRGIVFIGHSQGAILLTRLLKREVDAEPAVRRLLVSALVLGGNVTVAKGKGVGGDFAHIPACHSSHQTGCVVAYSSFTSKPSKQSQFGRTGSDAGIRLLAPHEPSPRLRIMCVNPAAPGGGTGSLDPYVPSLALEFLPGGRTAPVPSTPWVSFPDEYTARCESSGQATWLQVTRARSSGRWPDLTRMADPALGLHIVDVNIALGNLVRLVHEESLAYTRIRQRSR